jgi:hypothetical protein
MTIQESHQRAIEKGVHPDTLENITNSIVFVDLETGRGIRRNVRDYDIVVIGGENNTVESVMTYKQWSEQN